MRDLSGSYIQVFAQDPIYRQSPLTAISHYGFYRKDRKTSIHVSFSNTHRVIYPHPYHHQTCVYFSRSSTPVTLFILHKRKRAALFTSKYVVHCTHICQQFIFSMMLLAAFSMVGYLWLVWYHATTKVTPKHWALAVTYELNERAYATIYQVCHSSVDSCVSI